MILASLLVIGLVLFVAGETVATVVTIGLFVIWFISMFARSAARMRRR